MDPETLRKRHEMVMQNHFVEMRRSHWRMILFLGFAVFVILFSLLLIIHPEAFGAKRQALGPHLGFAIVVYSAALLLLVLDSTLTAVSRTRAIRTSIRLTELSYEVGKLIGAQTRGKG